MSAALSAARIPGGKAACRAQTTAILRSAGFARSQRMQRLLAFLVDETLAGRASQLKEYTIAVGAFDRPPSFDPGNSALVRVEAGRLRRLLEEYRREHGREDELELVVPKGSYVPVFRLSSSSVTVDYELALRRPGAPPLLPISDHRSITIAACKGARGVISPRFIASCESIAEQVGCSIEMPSRGTIALFFGWPMAIPNSSDRALAGALDLLAATEEGEGIHIGVATGDVGLEGTSGDVETRDIVLQILDLAQRMAVCAPNDAIMMSEATRRAARAPSTLLRPFWSNNGTR